MLKAITLGDSGVGKTTLLRALRGEKWDGNISTTIGVDYVIVCYTCTLERRPAGECDVCKGVSRTAKTQILFSDTGGQERFRSTARTYYRSVDVVLLCFKLGDEASVRALDFWYKDIVDCTQKENVRYVVLGLQEDLLQDLQTPFKGPFPNGPLAGLSYFQLSSRQPRSLEALLDHLCQICREAQLRNRPAQNNKGSSKLE